MFSHRLNDFFRHTKVLLITHYIVQERRKKKREKSTGYSGASKPIFPPCTVNEQERERSKVTCHESMTPSWLQTKPSLALWNNKHKTVGNTPDIYILTVSLPGLETTDTTSWDLPVQSFCNTSHLFVSFHFLLYSNRKNKQSKQMSFTYHNSTWRESMHCAEPPDFKLQLAELSRAVQSKRHLDHIGVVVLHQQTIDTVVVPGC